MPHTPSLLGFKQNMPKNEVQWWMVGKKVQRFNSTSEITTGELNTGENTANWSKIRRISPVVISPAKVANCNPNP